MAHERIYKRKTKQKAYTTTKNKKAWKNCDKNKTKN